MNLTLLIQLAFESFKRGLKKKRFCPFNSILKCVPWHFLHLFYCFVILPVSPLPFTFFLEPNPYRVASNDASDEVLLLFARYTDEVRLLIPAGFPCFFPRQAFIGENKIAMWNSVYKERAPFRIAACNRGWKNKTCDSNFDEVSKWESKSWGKNRQVSRLGDKKGGKKVGNNFFALSYRFRTL